MINMKIIGSALYQWEKGRQVQIIPLRNNTVSSVHFSNPGDHEALVVKPKTVNGMIVADIPNILLQSGANLVVYTVNVSTTSVETLVDCVLPVRKRAKPADYVYTETEVLTGYVKSVNGQTPDENGNVQIEVGSGSSTNTPQISLSRFEGVGNSGVSISVTTIGADGSFSQEQENVYDGKDGKAGTTYIPKVTQIDADTVEFEFTPSPVDFGETRKFAVELPSGSGSSQNVELDTTLTQSGQAADAAATGARLTALEQLGGITVIEPTEYDIPKVFFGDALQQTKDEKVVSFRYISKTQDISGYAEIKAQGNSSMSYPKKNQTVKMFKDAECTEKLKVDFKGWGKQNKHVYKANWIDLSHARNVVSARLWGDIVKSRANYAELPELLRTSPNQGAIDGFPVKVYAAGIYQGRYTLNIPKDKWMANMDDELDTHCILCGEGYTSGCFREASMRNWTDEIHDTCPESISTRWIEVINFVMNSTDEEFKANLGNYFDVPSLIDYHLFGLVSCGIDAYGKNQLYMTFDGQKWIASMYDMDSTWGLFWHGGSFVATDYPRTSYEDYLNDSKEGNLLYNRLEQLFKEELQARWAELKNSALSIENIINRFERFTDIATDELIKEDYASTTGDGKFAGIPQQGKNNIQQLRGFALARIAWTDGYVAGLTGEVEPDEPDEPDIPDVPDVPDGALVYSLNDTVLDGTSGIDTGVMLQDEDRDYTVFVDFTPVLNEELTSNYVTIFSCGGYSSGWFGYDIECGKAGTGGNLSIFNKRYVTWGDYWGKRQRFVIRKSNGNFYVAVNNMTALDFVDGTTDAAWSKINTETLHIGCNAGGSNVCCATVHNVKVWFEAKTDEECLAMVNG